MVSYTHVSVYASDLDDSAEFYEDLFGMERVPAPNFNVAESVWLRVGSHTLHLFTIEGAEVPTAHHFGLHVENFDEVYRTVRDRDLFDTVLLDTPPEIRELPDGTAQTYLRDPDGNLVELNYPDVDELADDVKKDVIQLSAPQTGEHANAKLYLDPPPEC